jgi:L-asparaginase II
MQNQDIVSLVNLTRGDVVESIHSGAFVIADRTGKVIFSQGNPGLLTYPRSSMKPLQALPFIEKGGDRQFALTPKEVAIICASHSGTDEHVNVIKSIHAKVGLTLDDLRCGVHWPSDKATAEAMRLRGDQPNAYHHNCSGKHSGMLAHAKMNNNPLKDYLSMEHPVQNTILNTVAEMCEMAPQDLAIGVDGCSAPVFAMPLVNYAMAIAKLCEPVSLPEKKADACQRITSAMSSHPMMVAGPGKLDTILMQAMKGKVISKAGAEGYQIIGILPGALGKGSPGLGIAIKIADGDQTRRALDCLTVEILRGMGLLDESQTAALAAFGSKALTNWRGLEIGEIRPVFEMPAFHW